MGAYRCEHCEGYYCSHEVNCYEHPTVKFGLVCEDCHFNNYTCPICDKEGIELAYCKITDQYFCTRCEQSISEDNYERFCENFHDGSYMPDDSVTHYGGKVYI